MSKRALLYSALLAVTLAGCGSDEEQTVAPKTADRKVAVNNDPRRDPVGAVPVTVPADALALGRALGPNGDVAERVSTFTMDDTVHVVFSSAGRAPGMPVTVFWTYQDGRTHHEERGPLQAGEFAHYEFGRLKGMQPGKYNVEVQIANRPIGIADFVVQ